MDKPYSAVNDKLIFLEWWDEEGKQPYLDMQLYTLPWVTTAQTTHTSNEHAILLQDTLSLEEVELCDATLWWSDAMKTVYENTTTDRITALIQGEASIER